MKFKCLFVALLALLSFNSASAQDFINLTPKPKTMTTSQGSLTLPKDFGVSQTNLTDAMKAEVEKFLTSYNEVTDSEAKVVSSADKALIRVEKASTDLGKEGYKLSVKADGVTIQASEAAGLYFAFQTIKKVLPPHVMAGVKDANVKTHALPFVEISDSPRFAYRGFMLDVSRHFFDVAEIKRVLDVMSYYKMNHFHWHLTDDHGWRVEIKKYPKLIEVGSIAPNNFIVDMHHGPYWQNKPYGPYYYTQEQLREVVAYAKERHIEIIPEIDMPGHFCAAMASYPEFSCWPNGSHGVQSNIGGVYADVLNVANPKAVQFAKDVMAEIMDIFPYEYVHIGGDECPTSAWEGNAECIAKKEELGLNNFRELQSEFIREMGEFVQQKGRKLAVWNEAITAGGADTKKIQDVDATVYCWVGADGAASKSVQLGLQHIYTPQVPWYINRKQSTDPTEPVGAGPGNDNLEVVYNKSIPMPTAGKTDLLWGVQATFWAEYVGFNDYLEYLMLPRLVAIAEAGWSPQSARQFEDFCRRVTADSVLYNYNNYTYGKHYMTPTASSGEKVMPEVSTATKKNWYRIFTRATGERANKCIELLRAESPLITEWAGKGAQTDRLWTAAQVAEGDPAYDYQFWALEEDPAAPGKYALVCKAKPEGSISPNATATTTAGRWDYDNDTKHYNFILADNGYGLQGDYYYYSIRSDKHAGVWMNASLGGQGYAVNLYGNPSDGNGGLWGFAPLRAGAAVQALQDKIDEARRLLNTAKTYPEKGKKKVGFFGENETNALRDLINDADPSGMTSAEEAEFSAKFDAAYAAFRNSFGYLEQGKTYRVVNTVEGYGDVKFYDNGTSAQLLHTTDAWAADAWTVTAESVGQDYAQTVKLQNAGTARYIGAAASSLTGRMGYLVPMASNGADIRLEYTPAYTDFVVSQSGKNLHPIPADSPSYPGVVSSGNSFDNANAHRGMGAAWTFVEVEVYTFQCVDESGANLGTFTTSHPVDAESATPAPPVIKNHEFLEVKDGKHVYKRSAYTICVESRDSYGAIIARTEHQVKVGETLTLAVPAHKYYTLVSGDYADGHVLTPTADATITYQYTTDALAGVKALAEPVTTIEADKSYVLYDTSPVDVDRQGYRNVNNALQVWNTQKIEGADPLHVWTLKMSGAGFKVKNEFHNLYVPRLTTAATPVALSANGETYKFKLNADGETFTIQGTNNVCWDGLASGALVGWNAPGHPYKVYQYFVEPYFTVLVDEVDTEGRVLASTKYPVKAGSAFALQASDRAGFVIDKIEGAESLACVESHLKVTVTYMDEKLVGITLIVRDEHTKSGIYDPSGRRIDRISHPGVYIIGGQKILVK